MPLLFDMAFTSTTLPDGGGGPRIAASKYLRKSPFESHIPLNQSPSTSSASPAYDAASTPSFWNSGGTPAALNVFGLFSPG